jgi:hypothetical protein
MPAIKTNTVYNFYKTSFIIILAIALEITIQPLMEIVRVLE